jgi:AraC family transcriptional regulator of adaptative response / DNA-3-methyladenine glycosylase II
LGIGERHLRRVIGREFGVSPVQLARTQRLLLAKRLLTDTDMTVGDVAFASGFSSLRRFNALFQERYRLNPTGLRKRRPAGTAPDTLVCEIGCKLPLNWDALLEFLVGRASCGVEAISEDQYLRTVQIGEHRGWISAAPSPNRPTLRVPGAFDGFEMAVRAILGQQVTAKAASTLASRFAAALGEPLETLETPFVSLTHLAPTVRRVAEAEPSALIALGIYSTRANSILAATHAVSEGQIRLEPGGDVEETPARLKALPGIGEWTA